MSVYKKIKGSMYMVTPCTLRWYQRRVFFFFFFFCQNECLPKIQGRMYMVTCDATCHPHHQHQKHPNHKAAVH
eukprot:NODE_6614_length_351_cov_41.483444_g5889_i0.p1 GENE.NODE_6614_length_351_cov_41.483444_g5889_i0~~NODE_6614_length_351_cov_41.483444_g5889_i0.p1  ORF type:complete len:73 (-),score=35.54 NODE_6614_length_351_cov_41.483444_g5889_i0:92-310(-)